MSRKKIRAIILATWLLTGTVAAQPVGSPDLSGKNIVSFEVTGNVSVASDTIRAYLGVNPGEPYDPALIQRNFPNLWQTGLFDDIRIEAERSDQGVVVRAIVKERPRIGAVEYRGNKELTTTKIGEAFERAKIDLHVGNTIEQTLVNRAAETIKNTYSEGGYEGVTVTVTTEAMNDPAEKKIVFKINEGVKARVAGIDFVGNKRFSDRRLRSAMKEVRKSNLITRLRKKDLHVPSKLDEDLQKVKNLYLDQGYKDVEFGDPQVVTVRTGKKPRVKITVPIKEGEVHTFGKVTIEGNNVFTADQIIGNWPLKTGDVLRRRPIQNRIEGYDELYRRRGHIYAYLNPEYRELDNNVVDVHIQVFEGESFKLGRLEFTGNLTTKDKVLRREIFINEGSTMDMETFKASMYKLGQLGYYKVTENPDFKVNQEKKTVDITVKGQEEGKNDVQFGGGYSETYGFFGQFQFSTRNFLGEGESLGVNLQRGRRQNFFSLSYSDPWFLDRPHSLGVSIFDRSTVFPQSVGFESQSKGGSVAYGFRIDRFESVSLAYGLERREEHTEFTPVPDDNGNIPLPDIRDEEFTTSALIPAYRYDSRNNPFDTTRGTRISITASYSGGPLGGTLNLFKPILNLSVFRPLSRRTTVSANLEAGHITSFDDQCEDLVSTLNRTGRKLCVPRSERFFVGGESSVRGFQSFSLGPKERLNGRDVVVGGYKYNVFNFEYIYKVNDPLRLVLFADAGNSYGFNEEWDPTDLRYSAGAEMRVYLPVFQFPLRFIYAFNPDPQTGDSFQAFNFSIGNTF